MRRWFTTMVVLALASAVPAAVAEPVMTKHSLTLEGALRCIAGAADAARKAGAAGVVAVVDDGGNLVAVQRLDGTFPAGANISIGKARTAALFKKPTRVFEEIIGKGRTAMVAVDFTPLQGGVPIEVDGEVVGAIGVSGAKSAVQDEELALAGAAALAQAPVAEARPVQDIPAEKVKAAFVKGMPLLEVENYKVHASHREAGSYPVEVHVKDTDIMHVLSGRATLVTGGTLVGGKETAPEEIRGTSVDGGETREVGPGDVLVIPSGTPHWFKQVPGPIDYYVVKVRAER